MNYHFSQIDFLYKVDNLRKQDNMNPYDLCKFFYEFVKEEIPNTHAFYVGIYNEYINQIGFPYTCDEDNWVIADYQPLGNGPSSWVIKNRKPFILDNKNILQHQSGNHFGNKKKSSKSALHYPMFEIDSSKNTVLVGVISIQSYKTNNYNDEEIAFFELIVREAGKLFFPFIEIETVKSLHGKLAEQTNVFNQCLHEIMEQIDNIKRLINRNVSSFDILNKIEIFSNHCKELQSTMTAGTYKIVSLKTKILSDLFQSLTPTEKKVVEKLLEGKDNKGISEALKKKPDSVKTHIKNICAKLNIENGREGLYNLFYTEDK